MSCDSNLKPSLGKITVMPSYKNKYNFEFSNSYNLNKKSDNEVMNQKYIDHYFFMKIKKLIVKLIYLIKSLFISRLKFNCMKFIEFGTQLHKIRSS